MYGLWGRVTYITSLQYEEGKRDLHLPANIRVSSLTSDSFEQFVVFIWW